MIIRVSAGHYITDRFLVKPMMEMNEKYEDLRFSLVNYYYKDSVQRLRDGKLDIVFLNLRPNYYFGNDLVSNDFCELHDIFVISSKVKDLYPSKVKLSDLNNYPVISK